MARRREGREWESATSLKLGGERVADAEARVRPLVHSLLPQDARRPLEPLSAPRRRFVFRKMRPNGPKYFGNVYSRRLPRVALGEERLHEAL